MFSERIRAENRKRVIELEAKRIISLLEWLQPETRFAVLDAVYLHYECKVDV